MPGAAAVFEGASFAVALRAFFVEKRGRPFWRAIRNSKDPANYTVLAEDAAALAGLAIAAGGVFLSHQLELPVPDGVASILIGLLLCGVAVLLVSRIEAAVRAQFPMIRRLFIAAPE